MTQVFTEEVQIDGSADVTQLEVQGHNQQTAPLQSWTDSTGAPLARISGDGRLQIGSFDAGMMATDEALIEAHRDEVEVSKPKRGLHLLGEVSGVLDSIVSWVVQEVVLKGTEGISALHSTLRVRLTNENTGPMGSGADLRGADVEAINSGGSSGDPVPRLGAIRAAVHNLDSGYVDSAVGIDVEMHNDLGVVDTALGIRVQDIEVGTNNYAIQTGMGKVQLGDVLEMVEQAATPGTPATGMVRLYPKTDGRLYGQDSSGVEYDLTGGTSGGGSAPTGAILSFAGTNAPLDWLLCDGTAVSRTTYADLFGVVGETYGAGDGTTTFNLPDLRGRVAVGAGQGSGLTNRLLGEVLGEEEHLLSIDEVPTHMHIHSIRQNATGFGSSAPSQASVSGTLNNQADSLVGGDMSHNNMPPSIVLNYIIKM